MAKRFGVRVNQDTPSEPNPEIGSAPATATKPRRSYNKRRAGATRRVLSSQRPVAITAPAERTLTPRQTTGSMPFAELREGIKLLGEIQTQFGPMDRTGGMLGELETRIAALDEKIDRVLNICERLAESGGASGSVRGFERDRQAATG